MMQDAIRDKVLQCYSAGLDAVKGDNAVYQALMRAGDLPACHVIALGKAAESMYHGVQRYLDDELKSALLISKYGHFSAEVLADPRIKVREAAHPAPAASSLQAGEVLLDHLAKLPAGEPCLFLISGGTSSLCEVLAAGWSLERLQTDTQNLLANGASIDTINAHRKQASLIKGGKLWSFMGERPVYALLISDVPDDDPATIGSGLLFPPPADADFTWNIVASNQQMLTAMAAAAQPLVRDLPVQIRPEFLSSRATEAAAYCVEYLRNKPKGLYLWGAETTVDLPAEPGRGGRNQHLALAAAQHLVADDSLYLLAVASDGTDGVSDDAGGLVDGETVARGELHGLTAQDCLQRADSGRFLAASGDLVSTGPTGTNVMDVVLGWRC